MKRCFCLLAALAMLLLPLAALCEELPAEPEPGLMDKVADVVTTVNDAVNGVVWGVPMLVLIVGTGILLTCRTGFFQAGGPGTR